MNLTVMLNTNDFVIQVFPKIFTTRVVITKLYYRSGNNTGIVPRVANLGEIEGACVPSRELYNPCMHNNKCYSARSYSTRETILTQSK